MGGVQAGNRSEFFSRSLLFRQIHTAGNRRARRSYQQFVGRNGYRTMDQLGDNADDNAIPGIRRSARHSGGHG